MNSEKSRISIVLKGTFHPQQALSIVPALGHPDVRDLSRPLNIGHHARLTGFDHPGIRVAPGNVPRRASSRFWILDPSLPATCFDLSVRIFVNELA